MKRALLALTASCANSLYVANLPPSGHPLTTAEREHFHILAMPKQKFAFCYIQKVASEHFGPMFNAMNNIDGGVDPQFSAIQNLRLPYSELTKENGWQFAAFVRDPLERYLSAFLSKCVPTGKNKEPSSGGKFCRGPTLSAPVTLEQKVQLFEERARSDLANGLPKPDSHWKSQTSVIRDSCGMDKFAPSKLDFIGHMTHDLTATNREVQAMLNLAHMPDAEKLAAEHFPPRPLALLQCPTQHCTKSFQEFQQFYRSNETIKTVQMLFQEDFGNFGFKKRIL